jgi:hypothetical protein
LAADEILLPFNLMSNPANEEVVTNPFVVASPVKVEVVVVVVDDVAVVSIFFNRTPDMEMSEVMGREGTVGVVYKNM